MDEKLRDSEGLAKNVMGYSIRTYLVSRMSKEYSR